MNLPHSRYLKARSASSESENPVVRQTQGDQYGYNLNALIAQYERIKAALPAERQELYNELFGQRQRSRSNPDSREIEKIIAAMNENGTWIEDIQLWDYKPGQMIEGKKTIRGFSVGTYISHMELMMDYLLE